MQKAHIIAEHTGVLIAGSGEIGSLLISELRGRYEGQADNPTSVMNMLRDHTRERYNEWFPSLPAVPAPAMLQSGQVAARPDLAFVVGGLDENGEAFIYQLASAFDFAPMMSTHGFVVAGVGQYALYLLNRLYQSDRSIDELVALAVYVITETASQDGKVGGPVRVIKVTTANGAQELDTVSVQQVVSDNEGRSENLRQSFYNGQEE